MNKVEYCRILMVFLGLHLREAKKIADFIFDILGEEDEKGSVVIPGLSQFKAHKMAVALYNLMKD